MTGHHVQYVEISGEKQKICGLKLQQISLLCRDGMVTFHAIRWGQMSTLTHDFEEFTGQKPMSVKELFEDMKNHLIGNRTSTDH